MRALAIIFAVVLLSSNVGSVLAEGQTGAAASCPSAQRVNSWKYIDDEHIYISYVDRKRRFLVTFIGPCHDAKWAPMIHFSRRSVGFCLEPGDSVFFNSIPGRRFETLPGSVGGCVISKVEPAPLSQAEQEALDRAWDKKKNNP